MLSTVHSWRELLAKLGLMQSRRRRRGVMRSLTRVHRLEPLENRRVLAMLTVNTNVDNTIADSSLSIREALAVVDAGTTSGVITELGRALTAGEIGQVNTGTSFGDNDKVVFNSTLDGGQILLMRLNGQLTISKSLTIDASSLAQGLTIKAEDNTAGIHNNGDGIRIFNITDPSDGTSPPIIIMKGMTLTGSDPSPGLGLPEGGAIRSEGILTLQNMQIRENGAGLGAGVYLAVAGSAPGGRTVLTIDRSVIDHNSAFKHGGGVFVKFSSAANGADSVVISNSSLSHNAAGPVSSIGNGGALFVDGDIAAGARHSIAAASTHFDENSANAGGGIFDNAHSRVDISILQSSTVSGNTATSGSGGGVYAYAYQGSQLTLQDSAVVGDTQFAPSAALNGGGIAVKLHQGSSLSVEQSTISGNTSSRGSGGGIWAKTYDTSWFSLADSKVSGNSAKYDGGGVFAYAQENTIQSFSSPRAITLSGALVQGNSAFGRGGGVFAFNRDGTETLIQDSRLTGNHVPNSNIAGVMQNGGGLYAYVWDVGNDGVNVPKFTITGSTVDNNDTWRNGGGVFVCSKFDGNFIATNDTFSSNSTLKDTTDPFDSNDMVGSGGGMFIAHFKADAESVDAYLRNVTFTQNVSLLGGGLATLAMFNDIRVRLDNTIISENYDKPATDASRVRNDFTGPLVVNESFNNLMGDNSTILGSSMFQVTNPMTGAGFYTATVSHSFLESNNHWIFIDDQHAPGLGPLQMNGGPTPTHALLYSGPTDHSPAIDAGSDAFAKTPLSGTPEASLVVDQRGAHRIFDFPGVTVSEQGPVDIGAYELQAPAVLDVVISSNVLTNPFGTNPPYSFADGNVGSKDQLKSVPVGWANQISIQFSSALAVGQNDLHIIAINRVVDEPTITGFIAPSASNNMTGTWTFSGPFPSAVYDIRVPGTIQDTNLGLAVDGEWRNPPSFSSTVASSRFPSGDGIAGGDFQFLFTYLIGDAIRDLLVDGLDFSALASNWQQTNKGWAQGDFNGDGQVNGSDFSAFGANWFTDFRNFTLLGDYNHDWKVNGSDAISFAGYYPGNIAADIDGNGQVNSNDYLAMQDLLNFNIDILIAM